MQSTDFENLELMTGEVRGYSDGVGAVWRGMLGAAMGMLISWGMLLGVAGLVRWSAVLWLWPSVVAIGASFGGMVGVVCKRGYKGDLRYGEAPILGYPLDMR